MEITQRDLEALRTTLDKLDRTIETFQGHVDATYVRKDVLEPRIRDLEKDIAAHQEWFTWAVRIILAVVILALLGAVIVQGKGGVVP